MKLRSYQAKLISQIHEKVSRGIRKIVVSLPTGGGKTLVFSWMAKEFAQRGKKTLIITHRREILFQTGGTFEKLGVTAHSLMANTKKVPQGDIVVAMVETFHRRMKNNPDYVDFIKQFDMIVLDELHIGNHDKNFRYFSEDQIVLGFSATPYRRNPQVSLEAFYQDIIQGPSVNQLISLGHLLPSMVFGTEFDMQGIRITSGDYNPADQEEAFARQATYESAIKQWNKLAKGTKTLAFTPSVASSVELVRTFNDAGVPSAHIDGTTPKEERRRIWSLFKSGDVTMVSNVGVATTGFDEPGIETIIMFMATRSLVKYLQVIGRGARPHKDLNHFKILDFGGNTGRFGFYEQAREWSLQLDTTTFRRDSNRTKICPQCGMVHPIGTAICSNCGYKWKEAIRIQMRNQIEVELKPISRYDELLDYIDGKSFEELEVIRQLKGYKKNWILHQINSEADLRMYSDYMNYKPGWVEWKLREGWKPTTIEQRKEEYKKWIERERAGL